MSENSVKSYMMGGKATGIHTGIRSLDDKHPTESSPGAFAHRTSGRFLFAGAFLVRFLTDVLAYFWPHSGPQAADSSRLKGRRQISPLQYAQAGAMPQIENEEGESRLASIVLRKRI